MSEKESEEDRQHKEKATEEQDRERKEATEFAEEGVAGMAPLRRPGFVFRPPGWAAMTPKVPAVRLALRLFWRRLGWKRVWIGH
jgi:hypothetical protein